VPRAPARDDGAVRAPPPSIASSVAGAIALALVHALSLAGCSGNKSTAPAAAPAGGGEPEPAAAAAGGADAAPDSPGELPMSEVNAGMDGVRATVRECARRTTYEGKVSVRVTIDPSGGASAVIEKGSGEPDIDGCVTGAFARASFPASRKGQRFRYSFTF
jgi:outer membrane biosynthesis protein TonB